MEKKEYLHALLLQSHIALSDRQIDQLYGFYELLIETSKVMNLTTITEFEDVCRKHFLDSLSFVRLFDLQDEKPKEGAYQKELESLCQSSGQDPVKLIDVGCGAGFPGLVLAIAFPQVEITLLDSLKKRIGFLDQVIQALGLLNCHTIHSRAEELAREGSHREQYDLAVSRAVANLSTLSEYCLPFVKEEGLFIAYKSAKIREEAQQAEHALKCLGGRFERQVEFMLPVFSKDAGNEEQAEDYRNLYVIRKEQKTPKKYPRKAGTPAKDPL